MSKLIIGLLITLLIGSCLFGTVIAVERAHPRVVSMGVIEPTLNKATTEVGGAPFVLNDSMSAAATRAIFPAAMATFTFRQDGGSAYTEEQLNQFMTKNWNDDVIYGLSAPSTIANEVMAWMHRMGWIGPVGKAISASDAYNFAYLSAPSNPGTDYDSFLAVRLLIDHGKAKTGEDAKWTTTIARFHFGQNAETGEYEVVFEEGGADDSIFQVEVSDS